ncbi:serine/threonine-protein kinase [Streptomyces sp. VNUA24]|uniref:serine/threonine-protein kinase n=1 Tax=Streptomyces sp. VNUA24 TaxID=3031131 RepID=UPI0023B8677A|nr:serine/threonine-protein kinase [Streptomyces sp. VNUA24]WEH20234.1 serine/threonine-protein kinase [Streptomyces sp. VNUA24]
MQGLLLAGRYRLADTIGSGGMGRVWRAHDEVLHRAVAIKELTAALYVSESEQGILLQRTRAEARAAARINHSAVVTVHDVLEHDGRPWIVMELVEGVSLADAVKERGRVEAREAARIGMWVLRALGAAHRAGVLHRDVKPGNVLLAEDGRVLLTDFGIAQVEGDTTITRTGEIVGSVDYIAPERVRGHDPGPASDLWSLGATLYTAVEGKSPFRRTTPLTTMQAVVGEEAAEPAQAGPLGPVITALLCKDPAVRPAAAEVEQMLAEAAEGRRPRVAQAYVPTLQHPAGVDDDDTGGAAAPNGGAGGAGTAGAAGTDAGGGPGRDDAEGGPRTATGDVPAAGDHGPGAGPFGTPAAPTAPSSTTRRRGRGRTVVAVLLLAALVGGGGAAAMHYADTWRTDGGSTAGADGADDGVPGGWKRVEDPEGFSLALPRGWKRQVKGTQIDYTPDDREHFLRIAVDDSPDFDSPYHHQLDLEEQLRTARPEYERVTLKENIFRDRPGALWDFTWTAPAKDTEFPGPRRAIEQMYLSRDGVEYTVYMSAPAADWKTAEEQFYAVLRSWRPPKR